MHCTAKIYKCKTIQEAIAISNDDHIEIFQSEDLKARPIVSGLESPIQQPRCLI